MKKKKENIRTFSCFLMWKFFTLKLQGLVELPNSSVKPTKLEYIILTHLFHGNKHNS